jgi:hypothetical protein
MSTPTPTTAAPSPALVAASPYLKQAIADLKACVNTILTGDPAQIGLRAGPAVTIFVNQVVLLEPGILAAEEGIVQSDINSKLDALSAKLP